MHKIIDAKNPAMAMLNLAKEIREEEILFVLREAGIYFNLPDWRPNDLETKQPEKFIRIAASIVDLACLITEKKEKELILPAYLAVHLDSYTLLLLIFSAVFLAIREEKTFAETYEYVKKNYRLAAMIPKEMISNN